MTCVSPPRSLSASSASDYGTCGSTSDEETALLFPPGICPHCKQLFEEPQTLQCGHSLCTSCVTELLSSLNTSPPFRRCRIRMGLRSYNMQKNLPCGVFRSPACLVCQEPPKYFPPVPNIQLQMLLRSMAHQDHPAFRGDSLKKVLSSSEIKVPPFPTCKVAILGARGVGKSSLKRVQHGNDLVFKDVLGTNNGTDYLMIEMTDGNNSFSEMDASDGFILVYSITDRKSFRTAVDLFSLLQSRRSTPSVVLVASKTDLWNERAVSAYEGQNLARSLDCPFLEVSAKKNDSVNEAFKELARLVEIQRLKNVML